MGRRLIDIQCIRFGRLIALRLHGQRGDNGAAMWECHCDCGSTVSAPGHCLRRGQVKSCGCLKIEKGSANLKRMREAGMMPQLRHGDAKAGREAPEWSLWHSVKGRCDPMRRHPNPDYAGRGIRMCEEWRNSYEAFLAYVGRRPSPEHTLDRIEVNGHYEPGNVRWATKMEQARNRRNSCWIECDGRRATLAEWAERTGLKNTTIRNRIRAGWSVRDALTKGALCSLSA
jgi:hypothetical protein